MSTKNNGTFQKIGERIKLFRVENSLTLVQLADIIGISHGSLSGLENNKSKPSAETLASFCLYTDINIEWLLTGKGNKNREEKKIEKQNVNKKAKILGEVEEWLNEEIRINPGRETWFELQMIDSFESFKKWKRKRDETVDSGNNFPSSKVA
jgi:transcriptional regulator with XRE-family HTH domain